jgi:hypothetical protein
MKTIRPALHIALESVRHFAPKREIPTPYYSISIDPAKMPVAASM